MSPSVCLPVCLSVCLSVCVCLSVSACLCICLFVCLSVSFSISLSVNQVLSFCIYSSHFIFISVCLTFLFWKFLWDKVITFTCRFPRPAASWTTLTQRGLSHPTTRHVRKRPRTGRWVTNQNSTSRYGPAYRHNIEKSLTTDKHHKTYVRLWQFFYLEFLKSFESE